MDLEKQIYVRKSCRDYMDEEIDLKIIDEFMVNVKPLNDNIKYYYKILKRDEVNLRTRWSAPYYLALFSQIKDNYKENIGFVFQSFNLISTMTALENVELPLTIDNKLSNKEKKKKSRSTFNKSRFTR